MSDRPKLEITFPTEAHRDDFLGWLSDGGGEYMYMEGPCRDEDFNEIQGIERFDYRDAFSAWGWNGEGHPIVHCYTGDEKPLANESTGE